MKTRHSPVVEIDSARSEAAERPGRTSLTHLTHQEAVQRILRRLTDDLGPGRIERFFDHATSICLDEGGLNITVPTGFSAEWLDRKFGSALRRAAEAELTEPAADLAPSASEGQAPPVTLRFQVTPAAAPASDRGPATGPGRREAVQAPGGENAAPGYAEARASRGAAPAAPRRQAARPAMRYRFEDFVVGSSNRLAFSAAQHIAEGETGPSPAPLFIHGGCGLGKTHLLQALAARYLERRPGASVRYLTAETFTNDYITAVRLNQIDAFRKMYRGLDLLCLDDVHFLSSKEKTQNELLHTFDAINLSHANVVLASDGHPRDIERLSAGLISRFMSGVVVRLEAPDAELRGRIVVHLAQRRGLLLDSAAAKLVAEYSARTGGGSVREIEGILLRIDAVQRLLPEFAGHGGMVGILAVRKALGLDAPASATIEGRARRPIQIATIIAEVCRPLQVDPTDLGGRGRHKRVVLARSLIVYLARKLTTLSFPEIARALSRPNHSTVITAYQRVLAQMEQPGAEDLAPELGVEFAGIGLGELAERLMAAVRKTGDSR